MIFIWKCNNSNSVTWEEGGHKGLEALILSFYLFKRIYVDMFEVKSVCQIHVLEGKVQYLV